MKLLVFAALAVVVAADVSHLSSQYGAPISSYGVAQKSIFGSTTPAPGLHLPVKEQQDFNAQYSNFGVAGASTPSPILDGGFSFTTPAPNVDFSQGFVSSTPAPNVEINPVSFSTTPAPALRFDSGLVSPTIGPNVEINPVSFSTTPAPFLNFDSGLQGFNLNGLQNAGLLYQNQIAPELRFNSFSTPAPPVVAVQSTTIGGSINDAFGVSGESFEYRPQEQEVNRQLFFYSAPEDPEPVRTRINIAPATPSKKNVKYIFIKAPTAPSVGPVEIAAPPQNEEKTVVYVLVKKPEEEQQIYVKSQDPTEAPKPEVFFIKYKDQKEAEEAISKVQSGQAHAEGHVAATDSGSSNFIETINRETFKSQPIVNYVKSSSGQYSNLNSGLVPSNVGLDSGGWYILRDFNDADFDKNAVIQTLQVRHGVSPFFKISVQPNPNMPGQNSIRISPSGLGLPDKEYYYRDQDDPVQIAYREYIRDVVIYMSTARNEATKFGTDMFYYEKRIAEITPDTISLQNPITTYNAISLSELKQTNPIPFFDILQAMYPGSNITENTEVIVTSLEYLGQISQIIATTDRKSMNGYLTWTLVRHYIPYLSSTYTSALDTFTSALYGTKQPLERWEMCAGLVKRFMGFAVDYYEEKNHPITDDTTRVVNNTFASIVNVVKNKITRFQKTQLLYNHLKSKLYSLTLQVGIPENTKQEKYLKDYYPQLKILKSNLFESVQNGIQFQKKLEERRLNKAPVEDSFLGYALAEEPKVEYSPSDNAVIIPWSLLTEPFFEKDYPSAVIYGRLGVEIAEAVVSSIFPYKSLWTSDRKILSPYHMTVDESLKSCQSSLTCIEDQILNSKWISYHAASNETSLKTLIHLTAIDVAREALRSFLENTEHIHQPSLESYEDTALFFLAYAQTQCSESTSQQKLYENIVNFELPQSVRLGLVWDHLPDFAGSLGCKGNKNSQCRDIL
ncbi:hypothetical protein JTB14_001644 [Gonioctena quinquepunctata]|nr:hypothetical protein JTB14_001644 [Gonioctena quinquepunctata]